MFIKTNFSAAVTTQALQRQSESSSADSFQRGAMLAVVNARQILVTWLAVSSGLIGTLDDLKTMAFIWVRTAYKRKTSCTVGI